MKTTIQGAPCFAYVHVDLEPGESFIAESDAMASMSAKLDMTARFNGGFIKALLLKFLGGESLFVNEFKNNTKETQRVTLVQTTPGDMRELELNNSSICFQPGAFVGMTPGLNLNVRWAGFRSWISREGLFKLEISGTGKVFYGAYGGIIEKQIDGEFIVDSSHLVSYEPQMKLKLQMAGGLFQAFLVARDWLPGSKAKAKLLYRLAV